MAPAPRKKGRPVALDAAHRRLAANLRKRMRCGEFPPGAVLPSWRELARQYGVGVSAVQLACNVLRRDNLLAPTPSGRLAARDWESRGTALDQTILLAMTAGPSLLLRVNLYAELQRGIAIGAGELHCPLLLAYDDRLRDSMPAELLERPLKGVVVLGKIASQALRDYEKLRVPVVLADHPGMHCKLHAAGADNAGAVTLVWERLKALGHKRVAFLRRILTTGVHEVEPDSRMRQEAFESHRAEGSPKDRSHSVFSVFSKDNAKAPAFRALLNARPRFTAAIANDVFCAELLRQAAAEQGVQVPKDLSIVTFSPRGDHCSFAAVEFDFLEVGRRATLLLEKPRRPPRHEKVPGTWGKGRTIGPAPK